MQDNRENRGGGYLGTSHSTHRVLAATRSRQPHNHLLRRWIRILAVATAVGALLFASCDDSSSNTTPPDTTPPPIISSLQVTNIVCGGGTTLSWSNPDPTTDDLQSVDISWATENEPTTIIDSYTLSSPTEGTASTYTITNLTAATNYRFSISATDTAKNQSQIVIVTAMTATANDVDVDNDTLIDICNLDVLNAVRHNLAGTYYAATAGLTSGPQCGAGATTTCIGYELGRSLNFATAADYANGTVNTAWRPTGGDATTATNIGFVPIGVIFASTFEGNNNTISNLYIRSSGNAGLFNALSETVRNLGVINGAVYGSARIGIVVAQANPGSAIIASYATGTANGGAMQNAVGGLVGYNQGIIIASYATGTANGGAGSDPVGVLVGNNDGTITASYATGTANGGAGNNDQTGGLVGNNATNATIIASYATGNADGGSENDPVGGLVGTNSGTIIASYATATANGGAGTGDYAGSLVGIRSADTITASYGFGTATGETAGFTGNTPTPASAAAIAGTNAGCSDGTNKAMAACTGGALRWVTWATEANSAWNFGNPAQPPALKYADYDGTGTGVDYCALFPAKIPGTETALVCGTSLLPGQGR